MSKPITYDPHWQEKYRSQILTATEAVKTHPARPARVHRHRLRRTARTGAARSANAPIELPDTEIVHLLTFGDAPYAHRELAQYFRVNSFFIAENVRDIIQEGLGDYTPVFLSDIPRLFDTGQLPLDVALIQVTPPGRGRHVQLRRVGGHRPAAPPRTPRSSSPRSIPNMPRTLGDCFIHVHDIDVLVPSEAPILEVPPPEVTEITRQIAEYIAALIEDGSTIEFGIGRIPQALLGFLKDKKDLGVHTEMVTDGIIDLIESRRHHRRAQDAGPRQDRGQLLPRHQAALRLHRQQSAVLLSPDGIRQRPVHHPPAKQDGGHQHRAGSGPDRPGLRRFASARSSSPASAARWISTAARPSRRGGKAIIALPSTAKGGTISRIVTHLSPGAGVVTTRAGVHYVVTEYGVAYLHGKSIQERALALISIAHPKFRADLLREAIEAKYLSAEMADKEGKILVGPKELRTTYLLNDGTQINFRADSSDRRAADARPVLQALRGDDLLPLHEPPETGVAAADPGLRLH